MAALEKIATADTRASSYFAVSVPALIGLPDLRCDIYIQSGANGRKVLYRGADSTLSLADDERLKSGGVRHLFLREADRAAFEAALAASHDSGDAVTKLALTIERCRDTFTAAFLAGNPAAVVAEAANVAGHLVQVVNRQGFAMSEAMSLLDHDRCTFQHSCNVSLYCGVLGKRIGLPEADLTRLIAGGMIHDVGKRHIPPYILKKPGLLDDRERALIRQHPTTGFTDLVGVENLDWRQLMMCYQHHERIDGGGYPVGIAEDEIVLWARICAVADVFDALTANRSYRGASTAGGALEIMHREPGHFDDELLGLWSEIAR